MRGSGRGGDDAVAADPRRKPSKGKDEIQAAGSGRRTSFSDRGILGRVKPRFFRSQDAFRAWLAEHHADTDEINLGFYNAGSGKGGLTYKQALDEALCFGWIDGVLHRID